MAAPPPKSSVPQNRLHTWKRKTSLYLGKDEERWAHIAADPASDSPWKFVKSVMVPPPRLWENHDPITHKFASSLGIIPESAQYRSKLDIESTLLAKDVELGSGAAQPRAFWQRGDRTKMPHASALLSPRSIQTEFLCQPNVSLQPASSDADLNDVLRHDAPPNQLPTLEMRRHLRSKLLRAAIKDHVALPRAESPELHVREEPRCTSAVYDKREIHSLVPRRNIELVEGTLYDEEGPFKEGAMSDSLSVRLFYAPGNNVGEGVSFLITTPDNRVFSAAKRRRWAMDHNGNFFAAMEIKSAESKMQLALRESVDPQYVREFEIDLRKHYIDDILDEMQKAETLMPGDNGVTPHVLQTEDGKVIRLEEDFPEEAFFVIAGCQDHEIYPVIARVFVEAIRLLWHMHCHGWMHGDIKLENLMFNEKGVLRIIDFENASPFRGSPHHDGKIQLLSFDWTPPELEVSFLGRRMGPTGDLYALGCNVIRGFALRDGITDNTVRQMLMGEGLAHFVSFRERLLTSTASKPDAPPVQYGINLVPLLEEADFDAVPVYNNPARILRMFALRAPKLLQYILAHCVAPSPDDRNERLGVALAEEMLNDPANADMWETVEKTVAHSIELSGSSWVRPKLDEARRILELA